MFLAFSVGSEDATKNSLCGFSYMLLKIFTMSFNSLSEDPWENFHTGLAIGKKVASP